MEKDIRKIANTQRIDSVLPTVQDILSNNAAKRLIIISHFGRPKGKYDSNLSLDIVFEYLKTKIPDLEFIEYAENYQDFFSKIKASGVFLLDNIRFYSEEEKLDKDFSQALANLGNVYIMDAFGTIHRDHSSITGIRKHSDIDYKYGPLVQKELNAFDLILNNSDKSKAKTAILGGAKVSDKIKLINNMIDKVDHIIIGGEMAFTFLKVLYNYNIGRSLFDEEGTETVKNIYKKCEEKNVSLYLPIDVVINKIYLKNILC